MHSLAASPARRRGLIRRVEGLMRAVSVRQRLIFTVVVLLLLLLTVAGVGAAQMQAIEQGRLAGGASRGIELLAMVCVVGAAVQFCFCYLVIASIIRPVKVAVKSARKGGQRRPDRAGPGPRAPTR